MKRKKFKINVRKRDALQTKVPAAAYHEVSIHQADVATAETAAGARGEIKAGRRQEAIKHQL